MTLTIELTPEQEAILQAQAQAAGLGTEEYARLRLAPLSVELTEEEETTFLKLLQEMKQTEQSISQSLDTINANLTEMVATAKGLQ